MPQCDGGEAFHHTCVFISSHKAYYQYYEYYSYAYKCIESEHVTNPCDPHAMLQTPKFLWSNMLNIIIIIHWMDDGRHHNNRNTTLCKIQIVIILCYDAKHVLLFFGGLLFFK